MTEDRPKMYLHPFDLPAPVNLLTPRYSPISTRPADVTRISLGYNEIEGELVYVKRGDSSVFVYVTVPCEQLKHGCSYCECDDKHVVYFTQDQLDKLKEIISGT